jgi:hypothetical protein
MAVMKKRFVVVLLCILLGLYAFSWLLYFINFKYIQTTLTRHYGKSVATKVCYGGGALSGSKLEDTSKLSLGNFKAESNSPITPLFIFTDRYYYDRAYENNGSIFIADGTADLFGRIQEAHNYPHVSCIELQ